MKKKYNKAVCLDTCIFKNIVGFDEGNSDFSQSYNKDLLTKYIKHHGYNLSDYNLYEVLIKDNWNDKKVIENLLKLNSKTLEKVKPIVPETHDIIKRGPDIKSRNAFIKSMFENIVDFASEFYSQILNFSFIFVVYSVLHYYQFKNLKYDINKIRDYIDKVIEFINNKLKKEFLVLGKYTKTHAQRILNKYYLIINHLTIEWSNLKLSYLAERVKEENVSKDNELYSVLNDYINILKNFDYTQEIKIADGRTKANNKDNVIYLMSNNGFKEHQHQFTKEKWVEEFGKFLKNMFNALYDSTGVNLIIKKYYENSVFDFYIKHILQCKDVGDHKKLLKIVDPNDLIDLCALSDSYEKGFIFISNDAKINKVVDLIYNDKEKEFVNLFINFKFTYKGQ